MAVRWKEQLIPFNSISSKIKVVVGQISNFTLSEHDKKKHLVHFQDSSAQAIRDRAFVSAAVCLAIVQEQNAELRMVAPPSLRLRKELFSIKIVLNTNGYCRPGRQGQGWKHDLP